MSIDEKRALIIVDAQKDFFTGGALAVKDAERIIEPLNTLSSAFFEANFPVFGCRDWHPKHHKSFKPDGPYPIHCVQGTPGAELHPDLATDGVFIVDKAYDKNDENMSAFADGRLLEMLKMTAVRGVYIGGVSTEFGVKATALDSIKAGFPTFVIWEAVITSRPDGEIDTAIAELVRAGVQFISMEEALSHLPTMSVVQAVL